MDSITEKLTKAAPIHKIDDIEYVKLEDIKKIIKKIAQPGNISKLVMGVTFNNEKAIMEVFESCL